MSEQIKVLDDRQQSREKLPIFFGSRDNYEHGVKEAIANAADELKNYGPEDKEIIVTLSNNNKRITVEDNGRGIPVEGKTDGVDNYELLFLKLFAGTKYDVSSSITTGTNGVGNTVLNYTSSFFDVEIKRNKYLYHLTFEDGGKLVNKDKTKIKEDNTGTKLSFELDDQVYSNTIFKKDQINDIVKHFAVASLGIKYKFYLEDELVSEYFYQSYEEYFEEEAKNTSTSGLFNIGEITYEEKTDVITNNGKETVLEQNNYNIFITTNPEPFQETYLNMTHLSEGGSILNGILDGTRLWLNKYCRDNKMFPKGITAFSKDDINDSLSVLGIVESNIVEFSNQTKLSTQKTLYNNQAKKYINEMLDAMLLAKPKEIELMAKHMLEVQKHNGQNERARKRLKNKLTEKVEGIGNKPEKLIDCEKHGINSELFITEGDSANGSIIDARDDEFQAAYPLRGKMLNTLKADLERTFKNQEIVDLVKIIGTGIQTSKKDEFDMSKLRYGKIIIATDADPDGFHIACLVITFIYKYLKPLLDGGHVYIAQTPLYELKFKDDSTVYFISEDDKNKNIHKYKGQKFVMNRLKGLGEVDAETMHETALNPKTRNLLKITVDDANEAEKMLLAWMDDDDTKRKELITNQLASYIDLSE